MEDKRISSPGYVPCVEAQDPEFRKFPGATPTPSQSSYHEVIVVEQEPKPKALDIMEMRKTEKPNDYTELAIVACCFNFLFALVALTMSFKSSEKWARGNRKSAKCLGLGSMVISILAICSTAVVIFICIWFFVPHNSYTQL